MITTRSLGHRLQGTTSPSRCRMSDACVGAGWPKPARAERVGTNRPPGHAYGKPRALDTQSASELFRTVRVPEPAAAQAAEAPKEYPPNPDDLKGSHKSLYERAFASEPPVQVDIEAGDLAFQVNSIPLRRRRLCERC